MKVKMLFYATQSIWVIEQLQGLIEALVPQDQFEMHRSFDSLSRRLYQSSYDIDIVVLTASNKKELYQILTLREPLSDIRIILILPDSKSDTISKAHTLGPRYLTYLDSDFNEIKGVLRKMLKNRPLLQIKVKGLAGSPQDIQSIR